MNVQYWLRIGGAALLIKFASRLVRDAEKLITANVKAENPDIIAVVEGQDETLTVTIPEDVTEEVVEQVEAERAEAQNGGYKP